MTDLSVVIAAKNEEFLQRTIDCVLAAAEGDTEIIAILDGYWPDPGIKDHPKVILIHHEKSIGQRAAINEGVKLSRAKYIMKLDAHCSIDQGFDVKLMADCEYDWTVVPRMYNLHAFNWKCKRCKNITYQGPTIKKCEKCGSRYVKRQMVWKHKTNPTSDFMRFDSNMKFQYWREYKHRPEAGRDICDQMSAIGACWFMHRQRYLDLGGLDEKHGSWGQVGTEIACKSWLSGGRQVVNKKTWFAHMFRTQGGDFGFPYRLSGRQTEHARKYSQDLWLNDKWPQATRKLQWLIDKFSPVPDWPERQHIKVELSRGLVYYTDNRCEERILQVVRKQILKAANGHPIVSVSQCPIDFGDNIVMPIKSSVLSMFKQMLAGLERIQTDVVFFVEHDILYHPSHFDFTPPRDDVYYYNCNCWKLDTKHGQALFYDDMRQVSGLCAYRDLLIKHYKKRIERVEKEGWHIKIGYEPGKQPPKGIDTYRHEHYLSKYPNVDLRHKHNITRSRFSKDKFRQQPTGWILADEIPFWGKTGGRVEDFLIDVANDKICV